MVRQAIDDLLSKLAHAWGVETGSEPTEKVTISKAACLGLSEHDARQRMSSHEAH